MLFVRAAALLSFVVLAVSKPLGVSSNVVPRQESAPLTPEQTVCGDIVIYAQNGYRIFYAEDVFRCLAAVPFNDAVATRFVSYFNMTLQFQSTLTYLKNPPPGYQQPAVDVMQVLGQIQKNITDGVYKNQYSFEADVHLLVNRMHDVHVTLSAGILDAFSFISPYGLVSVSADGKQAPEIYIAEDLLSARVQGYTPSPITKINGRDAVEFLTEFAALNSEYLEPHAEWNSLMDSPPLFVSGDLSIVQSGTFYPGNDLNATFKNGTEGNTVWLSVYNELDDTGPLTTAGDFYNYFVLGLLPASYNENNTWWPELPESNDTSSDNTTTFADLFKGLCDQGNPSAQNWCEASFGSYPNDPAISQDDLAITGGGVVTGYFLDDISTGVLSIPTFQQYDPNIGTFVNTVANFIGNATKNNITRVVIDLQTNSGGAVFLAYNTFKNFFYNIDPFAASRIRSHPLADVLGTSYSQWWKDLEKDLDNPDGSSAANYAYTAAEEWVIINRINAATGGNFSSWADYYGRVSANGDVFSSAQRYNLSDEVFDANAFGDWIPYGYGIGIDNDPPPQPWAAEDIVILTDGLCSSACAIFVEMMSQAGVRTIVAGGRPETGPMQAVSGSRGARVYDATELDDDFSFVSDTIDNETAAAQLPSRVDTGMWITTAGINIRDQVRANDPTPLQFKFEAADCRIYYTLDNVFNMTRLWRDAAKATWDDSSLCVANSRGYPSARNTTSLAPPKRTTYIPTLDLDPDDAVQIADGNNTLGGMTASDSARTGEIKSCATPCGHGRTCQPTQLKCGKQGVSVTVQACLPKCASTDKTKCPGTSECDYGDVGIASKSNTFGDKKSVSVNKSFQQGFCRPTKATKNLACPR